MSPPIRFRSVSCRFGTVRALDRVDLEVNEGCIHALIGPNGAGKTTVLRAAAGLVGVSDGDVRVLDGTPRLDRHVPGPTVGWIPAGALGIYRRLSGFENLVFFGRLNGLAKREAKARAMASLESVGLAGAHGQPTSTYSQGMVRRLAVARGLLMSPPVLLVDEATHDLDPEGAERIRELVARAARERGAAVLWATQRLEEIRAFADAVTVLDNGQVRFEGPVDVLLSHGDLRGHVLRLGPACSRLDIVGMLDGIADAAPAGQDEILVVPHDGDDLGTAIARLVDCGVRVLGCREERSSVELAVIQLTRRTGQSPRVTAVGP